MSNYNNFKLCSHNNIFVMYMKFDAIRYNLLRCCKLITHKGRN